MTKTFLIASAITLALSIPAFSGSPPVESKSGPEACAALDTKIEVVTGGCRNTETGAALTCDQNGQCKDYFADPRYTRIKDFLDRNKVKKAQQKL